MSMRLEELPSPIGDHVRWFFAALGRLSLAGRAPSADEIGLHYASSYLESRPASTIQELFDLLAGRFGGVADLEPEIVGPRRVTLLAKLATGARARFEFSIDDASSQRLDSFRFAAPIPEFVDRVVHGQEGAIQVRLYGGEGIPAILLHGGGMDVSAWDFVAPLLLSDLVPVALDLRGHGRADPSLLFSLDGVIRDIRVVLDDIQLESPVVLGHSLGGHVGLQYAVQEGCRGLVCLDGPATLELGMTTQDLPDSDDPAKSFLAAVNSQDVRGLLEQLEAPAMFVLATGVTAEDRALMMEPRKEFARYLETEHPSIRVDWIETDHMVPLAAPEDVARLLAGFVNQVRGR